MPLVGRSNFVAEPRVYVIRVDAVHSQGLEQFLTDEGFPTWKSGASRPSEIIPEVCGRLCYLSFAGGRDHPEYIANLKRERHGSVLEHATITFILTGVSRALTHELVRHRAGWSYSQLSQRYVDESDAQVVCPGPVLACRDDPEWGHVYRSWVATATFARGQYRYLVDELGRKHGVGGKPGKAATFLKKLVRGAARSLLPGATETKIACTVNGRALRHFLEMRASMGADAEIRAVSLMIYRACLPWMPDILGDYSVCLDDDGSEFLDTAFIKV